MAPKDRARCERVSFFVVRARFLAFCLLSHGVLNIPVLRILEYVYWDLAFCYGWKGLRTNLHTFDPQAMKNGESLMDRGQLREAQAEFITVMDEMPFPVIFHASIWLCSSISVMLGWQWDECCREFRTTIWNCYLFWVAYERLNFWCLKVRFYGLSLVFLSL